MFFSSWRRKRKPLQRQARRVAARRSASRFRPCAENLEDRCVPTSGFLDPTFNGNGVVTTPIAPSGGYDFAVAVYPPGTNNAGKIVSVGQGADSHGNSDSLRSLASGWRRYDPAIQR
jgi:hypothetical protein